MYLFHLIIIVSYHNNYTFEGWDRTYLDKIYYNIFNLRYEYRTINTVYEGERSNTQIPNSLK